MIRAYVEPALYGIALMATVSGLWRASSRPGLTPPVPVVAVLGAQVPARANRDTRDDAVVTITDENLFRAERSSLPVQVSVPAVLNAPSASRKPALSLRGILGGPPWDALIEGVPGHEGAVVLRAGQRSGDLLVRAIRRDTVFIQGMDTTWKLTLRRQ